MTAMMNNAAYGCNLGVWAWGHPESEAGPAYRRIYPWMRWGADLAAVGCSVTWEMDWPHMAYTAPMNALLRSFLLIIAAVLLTGIAVVVCQQVIPNTTVRWVTEVFVGLACLGTALRFMGAPPA